MSQIDTQKTVYLFVHGRMDLMQKSIDKLVGKGFSKDKVVSAIPNEVGHVGDYMAVLWMPPSPDHIKIQRITKIDPVEPQGMIGLWKGVSKDDLFIIPL